MERCYTEFRYPELIVKFESFLVNDLSRTYIQMIRERADDAYGTIKEIRDGLLKLIAPVVPFFSERKWSGKEESIHLCDMPKADKKKINSSLEEEFDSAIKLIESGMAERDRAKVGLRWPLAGAKMTCERKISKDVLEIVKRQLNVKKIDFQKADLTSVELDFTRNEELEAEGYSREFARKVQAERKNMGMKKGEMITLFVNCDNELKIMIEKNLDYVRERTNSEKIVFSNDKLKGKEILFTVKEKNIAIVLS